MVILKTLRAHSKSGFSILHSLPYHSRTAILATTAFSCLARRASILLFSLRCHPGFFFITWRWPLNTHRVFKNGGSKLAFIIEIPRSVRVSTNLSAVADNRIIRVHVARFAWNTPLLKALSARGSGAELYTQYTCVSYQRTGQWCYFARHVSVYSRSPNFDWLGCVSCWKRAACCLHWCLAISHRGNRRYIRGSISNRLSQSSTNRMRSWMLDHEFASVFTIA